MNLEKTTTEGQRIAMTALRDAWDNWVSGAPQSPFILYGQSGSGKSMVARQVHWNLDEPSNWSFISWSALDGHDLRKSFAQAVWPGKKSIRGLTEDARPDPARPRAIVIEDVEAAVYSIAQRKLLLEDIIPQLCGHYFVALTSQVGRSPRFDPGLPEELGVFHELADPTWFDVVGLLATGGYPLASKAERTDRARAAEVARICRDSHPFLAWFADRIANASIVAEPEKLTGLTIKLCDRLLSAADHVDVLEIISEHWAKPIVEALDQGLVTPEARIAALGGLHAALYERLFCDLGREGLDWFRALLTWASIDPSFDLLDAKTVIDVQGTKLQLAPAPEVIDADLSAFFVSAGDRPRLTHRSVLDLYHMDWPYSGAEGVQSADRRVLHAACERALLRSETLPSAADPTQKMTRSTIAALRHRLRVSSERTWEQLELLAAEKMDLPGMVAHELAFARDDFLSAWSGSRLCHDPEGKRYGSGRWYLPALRLEPAPTDQLLRWTAEIMLADLAYQGLDDWDLSCEIADEHRSAREAPVDPGDKLEGLRYLDYLMLASGHCSTMLYETGKAIERNGGWCFKAQQSQDHLDLFFEEYAADFTDPLQAAYRQSLLSNHFVAEVKAGPLQAPVFEYARALCSMVEKPIYRSWDGFEENRPEGAIDDVPRTLDRMRGRLNYSRFVFLTQGAVAGREYLRKNVLDVEMADHYEEILIKNSQEWFYAYVQSIWFKLFANAEHHDHQSNKEVYEQNEDGWAQTQLDTALAWHLWLKAERVTGRPGAHDEILRAELDGFAGKFDAMDGKAAKACRIGAKLLAARVDPSARRMIQELGVANHFREEDRFYDTCLTHALGDAKGAAERDAAEELVNLWFPNPDGRRNPLQMIPPIMPAMLILRGVPLSFRPRVVGY